MKQLITATSILTGTLTASSLSIGGGIFNIVKGTKHPLLQCEYASDGPIYTRPFLILRPILGGFITTKASFFGYGGLQFDLPVTDSLHLMPSFAPGVYLQGNGKDMGFPLEFRSAIDIRYKISNLSGLGGQFYHISNGTLGDTNPGTECLIFYYSFDL